MQEFFTYILKSLKDEKFYYGNTSDLNKRIQRHNKGGVPSTKSRRPLTLHYSERFKSLIESRKRELFFLSIDGYNWLKQNKVI